MAVRYDLLPRGEVIEIVRIRVVGAVNGDRYHHLGAVHGPDRERVGQRVATVERLYVAVLVVERVRPHAVRRHLERTVTAVALLGVVDRDEAVVRIIDVGIGERAGRVRRAVIVNTGLGHRAGPGAGNDGGVVGAVNGDRHHLRGTVDGGHRERVGQRVAGIERLDCTVAVVEGVEPNTGRRHGEGAVSAITRLWRRDRRKGVGRVVDVGIGQRAGRRRLAVFAIGVATRLGYRAAFGAGNDGRVVAALDGDRHHLPGAIHGGHGERVGQRVPDIERLHRVAFVVERVGPGAVRGHRVGAVAAGACRR